MTNQTTNTMRNAGLSALFIIALMGLLSLWAWTQIPAGEQVPTHWNAAGEVDGYSSKTFALLFLPGLMLLLTPVLVFLPRIDPRGANIMRSSEAYNVTIIGVLLLMLMVHTMTILAGTGREVNVGAWIGSGVGLLFILIGNFMGKIRQNYTFGIKTPWTYDSKLSWDKTHRFGGKLFIGMGILMAISGFIAAEWFAVVTLVSVLGSVVVLFAYSYFVWRSDPEVQQVQS